MGMNPTSYQLEMDHVPVLTMWNPSNIRLTIENPGAPTSGVVDGLRRGLPGAMAIEGWDPGASNPYPPLSNPT